jgi:phosphoglucosamine mutase
MYKQTNSFKLFGTDGIRGVANQYPMQPHIIVELGKAMGTLLSQRARPHTIPKVVIGRDTRLSGAMIETALTSGLLATGVEVLLLGILPTPGISFITRNMRASAGIVISASHNPFYDNGIKIFGPNGFKISDETEAEIERMVKEDNLRPYLVQRERIGQITHMEDTNGRYIVYVKRTFPLEYKLWRAYRARHGQWRRLQSRARHIFRARGGSYPDRQYP